MSTTTETKGLVVCQRMNDPHRFNKYCIEPHDADEQEIRKQGLIATAGLIAADREAAELPAKLVAALEQAHKMFQYIVGLEQIDLAHRQAEQGLIETAEALDAARKAGI